MAVDPSALYGPQVDTSDPLGYPHGQARNDTVSGDGTGTPLERNWVSDVFGFLQSILARSGVAPSGTPDKVGASQYLSALQSWSGWLSFYGAAVYPGQHFQSWHRNEPSHLFTQDSVFNGSLIYFSFPPGQRGTIDTLRAHLKAAPGHTNLPIVKPALTLISIDPLDHSITFVASSNDPSATVTEFEQAHTIELTAAHEIEPSKLYMAQVFGESSGFALPGLQLVGVFASITGKA